MLRAYAYTETVRIDMLPLIRGPHRGCTDSPGAGPAYGCKGTREPNRVRARHEAARSTKAVGARSRGPPRPGCAQRRPCTLRPAVRAALTPPPMPCSSASSANDSRSATYACGATREMARMNFLARPSFSATAAKMTAMAVATKAVALICVLSRVERIECLGKQGELTYRAAAASAVHSRL